MSFIIKPRRGLKKDLPVLDEHELAFTTDTGEIYVGSLSGNKLLGDGVNEEEVRSIIENYLEENPIETGAGGGGSDYELTKSKIDTALVGRYSGSIQLGDNATTSGSASIALGNYATASLNNSTALGPHAAASGGGAIALGRGAKASGQNSTALGVNAKAEGASSIALGYDAKAEGENSIAIGTGTEVTEDNTVDFGPDRQVRVNLTPLNDRDAVSKKHLEDVIIASGGSGSGEGLNLDTLSYMNHSAKIFYGSAKQNQFKDAWEDMKEVDRREIEKDSTTSTYYGKLQYPNGEYNGVIIPDSVTSIGAHAFRTWGANDQPLVIPNSVTSISRYAFYSWNTNTHQLVIPNRVTSIGEYAFYGWSSNNHPLVIPDSVTSIDAHAFRRWSANDHPLVIPNSVRRISQYTFEGWSANNHPLVIPDGVTYISSYAFSGWKNVPYIEMKSETPPTLAHINAFGDQNDAPIYVPDGSVDDYKTATTWISLADRIVSINKEKHDIVLISDTEFTITQAYSNKTLIITSPLNVTITVPTQIVENIERGFFCDIVRYGIGEVVFSSDGIILNSAGALSIDGRYIAASLIKIDNNNEWLLIGGKE